MQRSLCLCKTFTCSNDDAVLVALTRGEHYFGGHHFSSISSGNIIIILCSCYPISGATWVNEGYLLQKLTASNVGALSVVFDLVLRLYSGWGYIGSRLKSKVIEFEETGWYDGDIEEKSEAEKARDLFLYRSDVQPVEDRLKKFSLFIGGVWMASCLALNVATNANPLFNQYDPSMLETLSYDDKIAEVVAKQSNGRPTYCDNRYYRAVANGGQGEIYCYEKVYVVHFKKNLVLTCLFLLFTTSRV